MAKNNSGLEAAKSREQLKKERKEAKVEKAARERIRVRIFPIWLRIIVVAVLIFLSLLAGAVIGYGIIGGGDIGDVFKASTWTHIIDLIEQER